ncbi:MAG: redox-sensing transcriptional repressor Rex [Treponema sp.]|nr:redox-sensing transcriptional repressor Rex [Treponema sp.]
MKKIPLPSKKRLVLLSRFLEQVDAKKITSVQISEKTLWSEATIRRDISLLELHNGVSNGYDVKILKKAIDEAFGLCGNGENSQKHNCAIVGLGNLGQAFLENSVFESGIFALVAAFDSNQNRVEILKSKIPLYQTLDLEKIIRQKKIEFVILTVEDEKAQKMTDRLVKYGVKGIVNYTNVILTVPEGFKLENASPEKSLAGLV